MGREMCQCFNLNAHAYYRTRCSVCGLARRGAPDPGYDKGAYWAHKRRPRFELDESLLIAELARLPKTEPKAQRPVAADEETLTHNPRWRQWRYDAGMWEARSNAACHREHHTMAVSLWKALEDGNRQARRIASRLIKVAASEFAGTPFACCWTAYKPYCVRAPKQNS